MAKNSEVYKTAQERADAFDRFCTNRTMSCGGCVFEKVHCESVNQCRFAWLDLECEEEKPLPCPFCGGEVVHEPYLLGEVCQCKCGYRSPKMKTWSEAIAAHNRVAKAVKEGEANDEAN